MLKESAPQQYQLEMVTLEELVPKNHLVRKVDVAIDFEFIHDEVAHLYCHDNGRPPIDPVILFKMMLLGYLFGVPSERRLVQEIQVNVAYRWFLRIGLTDKIPDASTLSQNRIRRFNGTDVFQRVFHNIVEQAIAKGMVGGRMLYTDSTHLKANSRKSWSPVCAVPWFDEGADAMPVGGSGAEYEKDSAAGASLSFIVGIRWVS